MDMQNLESLIENNKTAEIATLLTAKPHLATQGTSHQISPLLLACYYKKKEIANIIVQFLPDLNIFDACAVGKLEKVVELVTHNAQLLNQHSADGFTPVGLACYFNHQEIVSFLVKIGADVNLPSKNGFNVFPIHSAVANNNYHMAKILFNAGAYPNVCQRSGVAPLHTAAQNGNIEIIILLLEHGADVGLRMEGGKLPADLATEKGFSEIAEILSDD